MTLNEFSSNFDVLLNSYALPALEGEESTKATLALDEYEKSVLLTQSEEELVVSLYNGRNASGEAFETVEETRRYLANLVKEDTREPLTDNVPTGVSSSSKFFKLPEDLWFITYEAVAADDASCGDGHYIEVIPVTQDEYHRVKRNPYRGANGRRALRLDLSKDTIEVVSKFNVTSYYLRYMRKPAPIILVDLPDGLSINGVSEATECELHTALHQTILERAVALALQSRAVYGNNSDNK